MGRSSVFSLLAMVNGIGGGDCNVNRENRKAGQLMTIDDRGLITSDGGFFFYNAETSFSLASREEHNVPG